jgi:hypothetical protein
VVIAACGIFSHVSASEMLSVTIPPVKPVAAETFRLGTPVRPDGATLTVDSRSLRLNGAPWTPVMGEWHYTRSPETTWREDLLKLKAGGIDIVATYVFWIHHEEIEGEWDWSGRRNLREFVRLAGEAGLKVIVRCGPWCHGEVRNGGLPEWTLKRTDWQVRSQDAGFLERVHVLYGEIARQLAGQLWKDGGPVVGIQLDNEYGGPADYLLALKKIARDVGLDVPLYTRTGWPRLSTPVPFGEILPLYGAYAEGFWDRELTPMPGRYWTAFRFSTLRLDENIANEQLDRRDARDEGGVERYPYLTCEMGGGMMSSYHRRIFTEPADVEVPMLIKLGCGSTLPGYYMYHGGTNPEGRLTTLNEAQATANTNWNDLPLKNYDFQAPIGAAGQLRESYHQLRRLHLFLRDFGSALAEMPVTLPDKTPQGPADTTTLRWAVRSNGESGFLFVNNYERARTMPVREDVVLKINLPEGRTADFGPVTIPSGARFIWPFNLDLGHGVRLASATAQPICYIDDGNVRTIFFAETTGVPARFTIATTNEVHEITAGADASLHLAGDPGAVDIVVLSEADSLALWKGEWQGRERVFRTRAGLTIDRVVLRLVSTDPSDLVAEVQPPPVSGARFARLVTTPPPRVAWRVSLEETRPTGPLRKITLGAAGKPVAKQPSDADFADAAEWTIKLPADLDLALDPILRIRYVGDVARVMLNGRLLVDDFYHGRAIEIALSHYAPEITSGDLRIVILPLQRDAVVGETRMIYLPESLMPDFGGASSIARLESVNLVPRYTVEIDGSKLP